MKKNILTILIAYAASCAALSAQQADAPAITLAKDEEAPAAAAVRPARVEEATATVTGVVLDDATGKPIPGVSVAVVGHRYSTMTGDAGEFTLKVPVDDKGQSLVELAVSGPTQTPVIVALRDRRELTVRLMDAGFQSLTNVEVLMPLGTKERSHIAAATGIITGDNSLSVKGGPEALMSGRVAGLATQFRSGTDWSGANLILRGVNSLHAGNNPLLVIDGLIIENQQFGISMIEGQLSTPLGAIDVKDIEQITVLKDATSIYGAKGANGAILIQTKRTVDLATHIDVTALVGLNMQPKKLPVLGATDAKRYLTGLATTSSLTPAEVNALPWVNATLPQRQPDGTYLYGDYYKYNQQTDWQDEIFQEGFKQQYSINVSGGDETAIYGVSMGFQQKEGLIKGSDFQRFNARVNTAIKFTERIHFNTNMSFVYGQKNLTNEGLGSNVNPIYTALVKAPFTAPKSISETNVTSPAFEDVDALGAANPAAVVSDVVSENSFYRFMGSYNITFDLGKGFTLSETFGLDFNKEREVVFYPSVGVPYKPLPNAEITNQQMHRVERLFNIFNETRLNYKKTSGLHGLDATLGFRYLHATAEDDYGRGYNSASNYYQTINAGNANLYQAGGALGNWNWMTFYGNVDYSYGGRYFLDLTLSDDLSSRYGEDIAPIQVYPGVNAAWLLSSERFMQSMPAIEHLKLRAGFNVAGNDNIGNYNARRYYLSKGFLTNNGLVRGNLPNTELKPERSTKLNVGLDAAFCHQRFNLSVDVYKNTVSDMLLNATARNFTGFASYYVNGGEMENKGIEVAVGGRLVNKPLFSWDLNLTVAHNHNRVTKLEGGAFTTAIGDGTVRTAVDSPLGVFYGYRTLGVYATTEAAEADGLHTMVGAVKEPFVAGDVRFVNQNGDDLIDDNDRVQIGDPNADIFGGFTSVMRSRRFTLTADFAYSVGNDIYNYTRSVLESEKAYLNQTKAVLNRWRTEGDITSMPRAVYGDPHRNSRFSDRFIEDGSYLKLKSVTLSYDLPIKSTFLTGITVYGTCENVFTLTDYKGYDPEIIASSSNNPLFQGVDAFTTPTARTFYIGLKIGL